MPFINPIVFWTGLGAVSVPILIHLLNRRRFRIKDWAAMKFLLDSIRKNRRRLRIEELILLALRCLAILLLGLALSRFTGCSSDKTGAFEGEEGVTVFLLDDSLSMGQKSGVDTVFTAARGDLAGELERIHTKSKSHQVAILEGCLAKTRKPKFSRMSLTDAPGLAKDVRALEPSHWRMDLAQALAAAREQFGKEVGPKRLFVMSDFRGVDLAGEAQRSAIRKEFQELRAMKVEVVALDYGRPAGRNLTVRELRLVNPLALTHTSVRFSATVRNDRNDGNTFAGGDLRPSVKVSAAGEVQEVALPVQEIRDLGPGQEKTVEFSVVFQEAGPASVTVELPPDELLADNKASVALDVRKHVRVLVVDGQRDELDPAESESFYLLRAVDPKQDGSYGIRPEVIGPQALSGAHLEDYDAVVLMNVSRLPEEFGAGPAVRSPGDANQPATAPRRTSAAVETLERYVRQGGGLLVFAGDQVDVNYYNEFLWADGAGLLPYRMGAVLGRGDPESYVRLDPKRMAADRCLQVFQGEGVVNLVRFFRYLGAQEATGRAAGEADTPRVLAYFADGQNSPAIAARSFGKDPNAEDPDAKGTVIMCYSSGSARWNDWPTAAEDKLYPPFVVDSILGLARRQRPQTAEVDRPIVVQMPTGWSDATAVVRTPKYPAEPEFPLGRPDPNTGAVQYGPLVPDKPPGWDLPGAGVYSVRVKRPGGEERETYYARNVDPAEGDLTPAGEEGLRKALGLFPDSKELVYRQAGEQGAFGQVDTGKGYWQYALAALLAVLALEIFLGQRFGHYSAGTAGTQANER